MLSSEIEAIAKKLAIKNAIDYGRADEKAVLSKTISKVPAKERNVPEIMELVNGIVAEVNSKTRAELENEYAPYRDEFAEYEKEKAERTSKPRMELEGAVEHDFVTRFAPEPSGYMHIGHANAAFLAREFANIYKGRVNLYFDDTNAEKEKQEYVDAFKTDLKWLGIEFDREYYSSDNIEKMYKYAQQLISGDMAYVCLCSREKIKELRSKGKGCEHKSQDSAENLKLWTRMLSGEFGDNVAVLRFSGAMDDQNTAMRDPTLFRIRKHEHYRQGSKYCVWPTYDFNTPIMDSINNVTDAIRTKEYELRDELYSALLDRLGLRKPRVHNHSRIGIVGQVKGKREVNKLINEGLVQGYDDPRLVTIIALRRRGIQSGAIKDFVLSFGMSKTESRVKLDTLLVANRKMIDKDAVRLFAVEDPVEVRVKNGSTNSKLRLHPGSDEGFRSYSLDGVFYLDRKDVEVESELRLKDLYDVRIISREGDAITAEKVEGIKPGRIVQWVAKNGSVKCDLEYIGNLMDGDKFNAHSLDAREALAEQHAKSLNEGDIVQFERIGYFRLDDRNGMKFLSL